MGLTLDYISRIVESDESITDAIAFHGILRDIEASPSGMMYPQIHTYRAIPLGGGAVFPALTFVNGWTLQFVAGNFELSGGNYDLTVNPVPDCFVYVKSSAAYSVTYASSDGGIGTGGLTTDEHNKLMSVPTAANNASAVWGYTR